MKIHNICLFLKFVIIVHLQNTCFDIYIEKTETHWNLGAVIRFCFVLRLHLTAVKLNSNRMKMRTFRTYPTTLVLFSSFIILFPTLTKCDDVKSSIRSVDVFKTKVWGPGLDPGKVVLPVRYFFIQAYDAYGYS